MTSGIGGAGYQDRVKLLVWATWSSNITPYGIDPSTHLDDGTLSVTVLASEALGDLEYVDLNPFLGAVNQPLGAAIANLMRQHHPALPEPRYGDSPFGFYGVDVSLPHGQQWTLAIPTITAYKRKVEEAS